MPELQAQGQLSARAQRASAAEAKSLILDILANLWEPMTNPGGFVNVGLAENVLMHDVLLESINKPLDLPARYLTYNDGGAGSTRLKNAIAGFLNRYFAPVSSIQWNQVVVTNGVSSAIEHLSWALVSPGDGILLGRPYYGQFIPDIEMRPETTVVPVDFHGRDPLGPAAVAEYEKALLCFQNQTGRRVGAILICHPHNPLGRCYPAETIVKLMTLCQKHQIHLISDEIYALSTWDNLVETERTWVPFRSLLSIDPMGIVDPALLHVVWGMSKDFGANGMRIGAIVSQSNAALRVALRGPSLYSYVSGISDYIAAGILEDSRFTDAYIALNQERLALAYRFVATSLQDRGIEYVGGSNAGYFIWANLGKAYLRNCAQGEPRDADVTDVVMERLLSERVFLASGNAFGSEQAGWFRIVFSQQTEYLAEAMRRIDAALVPAPVREE